MLMQWSDELTSGVTEIDNQHKELFNRINGLLEAMEKGKGREEVATVINFLEDYVVTHFETEERYMSKYVYPAYLSHKSQHEEFINEFTALKKDFAANGTSTRLVIMVNRKVCDWLTNHILKVDKALGGYLKTKLPA